MKRSVSALKPAAFGHLWVLSFSKPAGQEARLLVVIFRVSFQVIQVEEVDDLSLWGVIYPLLFRRELGGARTRQNTRGDRESP